MSAESPVPSSPSPSLDAAAALIDRWNAIVARPLDDRYLEDDDWIVWDELFPLLTDATIEAAAARMSHSLRARFLSVAREEVWFSDPTIREGIASQVTPEALAVLARWIHRQPYEWRAVAPLPRGRTAMQLGFFEMLHRVLPHLVERSVDDVLEELPPIWRTVFLPSLGNAILRHDALRAIEATCRAQGQSPTPWRRIASWWEDVLAATLPLPLALPASARAS